VIVKKDLTHPNPRSRRPARADLLERKDGNPWGSFSPLSDPHVLARLSALVQHLHSPELHQWAPHADHPGAFARRRKVPLPSLSAVVLCGMCKSVQGELDLFFAHLRQQAQLVRQGSEQAFAQARAKLSHQALSALNDFLIAQANKLGWLARWQGLRRVSADAPTVRFGPRASHLPRAASSDQIAWLKRSAV